MSEGRRSALVLSGGHLDAALCDRLLKERGKKRPLLAAVDRGIDYFASRGICPDLATGDFDSASEEGLSFLSSLPKEECLLTRLNPEKDDTDTEHLLGQLLQMGVERAVLLGASGNRLDHVLANITLLNWALERGLILELVDENNYLRMLGPGTTILSEKTPDPALLPAPLWEASISLHPYSALVEDLSLTGLYYPLSHFTLSREMAPRCVSNRMAGERAEIRFSGGRLLLMVTSDQPERGTL